ncbi:hypothetical protein OK016_08540 [Vibrio chagasii]|nr:hypothetical protein [Vibrio chagasii]
MDRLAINNVEQGAVSLVEFNKHQRGNRRARRDHWLDVFGLTSNDKELNALYGLWTCKRKC